MGGGYNRGGEVQMSANPQAAATHSEASAVLPDNFIGQGRSVPMGNGWSWITAAWSIFRKEAGLWIGMTIMLLVIYFVLFVISIFFPPAGIVVGNVFLPVFVAGLLIFSRNVDQGAEAKFSDL